MAEIQAGSTTASSDLATESKQDDIIELLDGASDFEGGPVTVGTTAVELAFAGTTTSILIQSDPDNSGKVWVGKSNVTNAGANAMAQLEAGDAVSLDLDDAANAIYAVSDTSAQNVFKLALV
jgi:hypothetical protein